MVMAAAVAGGVALALAAGGGAAPDECVAAPDERVAAPGGRVVERGRFIPPVPYGPTRALTYDMRLVPAGAWVRVEQRTDAAGTTVTARLEGLRPGHAYGAHVHTGPCGADPKAAGGHYQHVPKPEADPRNEVWLDFTADAHGSGVAAARHAWGFRAGGAASVVLHDEPGGAGARIACFTVPFAPRGPVPEKSARVSPALASPVPASAAPEGATPASPAPTERA